MHPPFLFAEFEEALAALHSNRTLYLLDVAPDIKVLFRIDGLVIQLQPAVFDLLHTAEGVAPEVALAICSSRYPQEVIEGATRAVIDLASSPDINLEAPPLERPDARRHEPGGILIMVTQTCNLACTYCYAGGGTYGGTTKFMPEEDALRSIDLMLDRAPHKKYFTVTLFGGEPLLNFPLIRRIVDYCALTGAQRGVGFGYSMTSNGTIATDEVIELLKAHRFTLMISYDGTGQDTFRPFVGGAGSDVTVRRNLHRLAEEGITFSLRATITKPFATEGALEELVQIGRSLGNKRVALSSVSATKNSVFPANDELTLDHDDAARVQASYRRLTEDHIDSVREGCVETAVADPTAYLVRALIKGKAVGLGRCGAGLGMVAASTDGNIYPCHRFVGMKDYELGTIRAGVDPEKVNDFFRKADAANQAKCDVCFARQICGGFCFYNISDGKGGFQAPDEWECDRFRDSVKHAIASLLRLQAGPPEMMERYLQST